MWFCFVLFLSPQDQLWVGICPVGGHLAAWGVAKYLANDSQFLLRLGPPYGHSEGHREPCTDYLDYLRGRDAHSDKTHETPEHWAPGNWSKGCPSCLLSPPHSTSTKGHFGGTCPAGGPTVEGNAVPLGIASGHTSPI